MKNLRSLCVSAALLFAISSAAPAYAGTADSVAKAAAIAQRLVELNQKFAAYDVELPAPTPASGVTGKFLLPINENGELTEWAKKAINAQVGNIAGEQAGAAASKGLASVVPGGGLAGGFLKKKGKESGAMLALGGSEFIKKTSSVSFDSVEAYAVYLHAKIGKSADYSKAVQAAIALYPDLEATFTTSIQTAYDSVVKAAQAKQAAEAAAAATAAAGTAPATSPTAPVVATPAAPATPAAAETAPAATTP